MPEDAVTQKRTNTCFQLLSKKRIRCNELSVSEAGSGLIMEEELGMLQQFL